MRAEVGGKSHRVTVDQLDGELVAFLSFQIRVVAGLRALAGASAVESTDTEYTQIFTGVLASGAV